MQILLAVTLAASMQSTPIEANGQAAASRAPGATGTPTAIAPAAQPSGSDQSQTVAGGAQASISSFPASYFAAAQLKTAREMIDRLPGFKFDDGASARGFDAAAGNVLIDGELPASKNDDIDSILRRLPSSQVLRIDIIRGSASGIDMHGKSLVANVIRKTGRSSSGNVQLTDRWVTSDGRQVPGFRIEANHQGDTRTLEGSFSAVRIIDDSQGSGQVVASTGEGGVRAIARDEAKAGGYQAVATGAYSQPLAGGKLKANVSFRHQSYVSDESVDDGAAPALASSLEHDHQTNDQFELGLHYTRDIAPNLSLETLAIQQVDRETSRTLYSTAGDIELFREQHTNGESVGRATVTWRTTPTLTLETGAEAAYNWLHSGTRFDDNGQAVAIPAADVAVTEVRGEAFAKATWAPIRTLNVEAGLREEVSRIASSGDVVLAKTLQFPKPRLVVAWSPTVANQVRLRLEREVGQLDFNDFVAASSLSTGRILAGNPNLIPEQASVVEVALEHSFLKTGAATITLRHSELRDLIDRAPVFSPAGDFDAPANVGDGRKDELVADLSLPLKPLGIPGGLLKANLTWRRSSVRDPTTGEERSISALRPFEGTVDFSQDIPRWKLTWGGQVDVGWSQTYYRFNQIEADTLPVQGRVYVEIRPRPKWSVRTEVYDIGGGFDRTLLNWTDLRARGVPYADAQVRELSLGPTVLVRLRRDW